MSKPSKFNRKIDEILDKISYQQFPHSTFKYTQKLYVEAPKKQVIHRPTQSDSIEKSTQKRYSSAKLAPVQRPPSSLKQTRG
jgi:hypothetical protein